MANTPQFHANLLISADTKSAMQSLSSLQNSLTKLVSTSAKGSGLGNGITRELQEAQMAATKLQISLHQATNVNTGKLDLTRFSDSLRKSNLDLRDVYKHLSSFGSEGQKTFLQLANSIASAEVPLKRTGKMFDNLWTTMKNTAKWQLTSSMMHGFVGAVQSAYGYAKDLNKSLNDIRIVTSYNTDQMAKFAKTANDAAKALSTTTTRYTDAALIYYQQGLPESEIKARTEATIKMANVTGEAAKDVSNYMTAIWNNFDNGTKSLEYYADVMTALGAATASSTDEIAAGLEKFAAVSETVGLSYEYATAALATITAETRQNADVVGNALKTLFSRLQGLNLGETMEDGTTLNKYSSALEKVGVNIKDTSGQIKDMDLILSELGTKWNTLSKDTQIATAQTVAGVRQYTQLIALMDNWDVFKDNLNIARNASGTLNEQAEIYAESWEAASNRVRAAWEGIYDSVLDDDFFISVANGFAGLLGGIENVTDAMGGMKGVALGLGAIITKIFNKQMAAGLSNMAYGVKSILGINQKQAINFQKDALQVAIDNSIVNNNEMDLLKNTILQDQINLKTQLLNIQENLTAQQRLEAEGLINVRKLQSEQVIAAKQRVIDNEEVRRQNSLNLYTFTRNNNLGQNSYTNISDQVDKWVATKSDILTMLDEAEDLFNSGRNSDAQAKVDAIKNRAKADESYLKTVVNSGANNGYKGGRYQVENWKAVNNKDDFNLFRGDVTEALNATERDHFLKTVSKNFTRGLSKEKSDELNGLIQALTEDRLEGKAADAAYNKIYTAYQEQQKDALKSFENIQRRSQSLSGSIVSLTNSFANLGFAISSISGMKNVLDDETLSSWEKFNSILLTTTMVLPSAVQGSLGLFNSVSGIGDSLKARKENKIIEQLLSQKDEKGKSIYTAGTAIQLLKANSNDLSKEEAESLTKATKAANDATKASLLTFGKYALIIGAVVAAIALLVKAHQEMYENSPEGQLEKASQNAGKLAQAYEEATQAASDLNNAIENYDSAIKKLEECTKGTEEWRDALAAANQEALNLLNKYPDLQWTKEDGQITIDSNSLEEAQQQIDRVAAAAEISKINADQDVIEKQYAVDVEKVFDKLNVAHLFQTNENDDRAQNAAIDFQTAIRNKMASEFEEINRIDNEKDAISHIQGLIEQVAKNFAYSGNFIGNAETLAEEIYRKYALANSNLVTALEENTAVTRLELEESLRRSLGKDEYAEGEVELTNSLFQAEKNTKKSTYLEYFKSQAQTARDLNKDAQEVWDTYAEIQKAKGINLSLQGNAVKGDKNSREIGVIKTNEDGTSTKTTVSAEVVAETVAAYEVMEESLDGMNDKANALLADVSQGMASFIANGSLSDAKNIENIVEEWDTLIKNEDYKAILQQHFGEAFDGIGDALESEKQALENQTKALWESLFNPTDLDYSTVFNNLSFNVKEGIAEALNEAYKYGGAEAQKTLEEVLIRAGEQAGEVLDIYNSIDWSSGNAWEQFTQQVYLLGVELNGIDGTKFQNTMADIANSLPIDDIDTLISKIKELYGIIKDVGKGDVIDEETYQKLLGAGVDPNDFIDAGAAGYIAKKDITANDVNDLSSQFDRNQSIYEDDTTSAIKKLLDAQGYNSYSEKYNELKDGREDNGKGLLSSLISAYGDNQDFKDAIGIGNIEKDKWTDEMVSQAFAEYDKIMAAGDAGKLTDQYGIQQRLMSYGDLTSMSKDEGFDLSQSGTQEALQAYGYLGGEEYADAVEDYQKALEAANEAGADTTDITQEFYERLKKIETTKSAKNIKEMVDQLKDLNGESRKNKLGEISQELEKVFGKKVTDDFIENNKELIDQWSKGSVEATEKLKSAMIEDSLGKEIDEVELKGHLNIDTSQKEELQAALDLAPISQELLLSVNATGHADMSQLEAAVAAANGEVGVLASNLLAVAQTQVDFTSADLESLPPIPTTIEELEPWLQALNDMIGSIELGSNYTVPANANTPDMNSGSTGGGGGGKSGSDSVKDALDKRKQRKRDMLKLKQEGLDPEEASKYYQEEIEMIEEENKLLEEQIDMYKEQLPDAVDEFNKYIKSKGRNEFELTLNDDGTIANIDQVLTNLQTRMDFAEAINDDALMNELEDIYEALMGPLGLQENIDENVALIAKNQKEQAQLALEDIVNRIDWRVKQIDHQIEVLNYYQEKLLKQAHGNKQQIEAMLAGFQYQEQEMLQLFEKGAAIRQGIAELQAAKAQYPGYEQMFNEQILEYQGDLIDLNMDILELRQEMEELVQNVLDLALDEIDIQTDRIDNYVSMLDRFNNIIDLSGRTMIDQALKVKIGTTKVETMLNKMGILKQQMEGLTKATNEAQDALARRRADNDETSVKFWENQVEVLKREMENASDEFLGSWEETLEAAEELFTMRVELAAQTLSDALSPYSSLELLQQAYDRDKEIREQYLDETTKLYELNKLNRQLNLAIAEENDLLAKSKLRDLQEEIYSLQKKGIEMSQFDLDILQKKYDLQLAELALLEAQNSKTSMRLIRDAAGNWTYAYDADEEAIEEATQKMEDALYEYNEVAKQYIDDISQQIIENQIEYKDALMDLDKNSTDYQEQLLSLQEHYMSRQKYLLSELNKGAQEAGITFHDTLYGNMMDIYSFEDAYNQFVSKSDVTIAELMTNYKDWQSVVEQAMNVAGTSWETFGDDTDGTLSSLEDHIQALCKEISELVDVLMGYVSQAIGMVEEWQAKYSKRVDQELAANESVFSGGLGGGGGSGGGYLIPGTGDLSYKMTAMVATYGAEVINSPEFQSLLTERQGVLDKNPDKGYISNEQLMAVLNGASTAGSSNLSSTSNLGTDVILTSGDNKVYYTNETVSSAVGGDYGEGVVVGHVDFVQGDLADFINQVKTTGKGKSTPNARSVLSTYAKLYAINNYNPTLSASGYNFTNSSAPKELLANNEKSSISALAGAYNPQTNWCGLWVGDVLETAGYDFKRGHAYQILNEYHGVLTDGTGLVDGQVVGNFGGQYGHVGIYYKGFIYSTGANNKIEKMSYIDYIKHYGSMVATQAYGEEAGKLAANIYRRQEGLYTRPGTNTMVGNDKMMLFDTGGYTGAWGKEGRLAVLHEKELVLNKNDTANILDAVKISRSVDDKISSMISDTNYKLRELVSRIDLPTLSSQLIEQKVEIMAEFPGVTDQYEIQEAFANLSNDASQYLSIKNKG